MVRIIYGPLRESASNTPRSLARAHTSCTSDGGVFMLCLWESWLCAMVFAPCVRPFFILHRHSAAVLPEHSTAFPAYSSGGTIGVV